MTLTVPTIQVYSKEVGDELIRINEADFDSNVHRREGDGPWSNEGELKGRLPADFPGRKELEAFDPPIRTYAQLRRVIASDLKVPGIGDITKQQILERLGQRSPSDDDGDE
jgi:hypothetical protein